MEIIIGRYLKGEELQNQNIQKLDGFAMHSITLAYIGQ